MTTEVSIKVKGQPTFQNASHTHHIKPFTSLLPQRSHASHRVGINFKMLIRMVIRL